MMEMQDFHQTCLGHLLNASFSIRFKITKLQFKIYCSTLCAHCPHPANNFTSSKWNWTINISWFLRSKTLKNIKHCLVHMKEKKIKKKPRVKPKNPTMLLLSPAMWSIRFSQAAEFIQNLKSFSDPPVSTRSKVWCFQRAINLPKSCWTTRKERSHNDWEGIFLINLPAPDWEDKKELLSAPSLTSQPQMRKSGTQNPRFS